MTKVFISYAHTDEVYRKELEKHLSVLKRNGYIDTWADREIIPGENWGNQISRELEEAKIILLLISSDFLASNYCYDIEMNRAIERHKKHEAIVIPIILRFCDWSNTPFAVIQVLPIDAKPVKDWSDQDQAFLNIVEGIKVLLNSLQKGQNSNSTFGTILNPQIGLSDIRGKLLSAESYREIKEVKFLFTQYKKNHAPSFEIDELEQLINKSLFYEESVSARQAAPPMPTERMSNKRRMYSPFSMIRLVIIIVILIFLIIFIFRLLR